jgi:hypothetical protein
MPAFERTFRVADEPATLEGPVDAGCGKWRPLQNAAAHRDLPSQEALLSRPHVDPTHHDDHVRAGKSGTITRTIRPAVSAPTRTSTAI